MTAPTATVATTCPTVAPWVTTYPATPRVRTKKNAPGGPTFSATTSIDATTATATITARWMTGAPAVMAPSHAQATKPVPAAARRRARNRPAVVGPKSTVNAPSEQVIAQSCRPTAVATVRGIAMARAALSATGHRRR